MARLVSGATRVILLTQLRMWLNFYRRHGQVSLVVSLILSAIWYAGFTGVAAAASEFLRQASSLEAARRYLGLALFGAFAYWQGMPLLMASIGAMVDWRKLMIYPVPQGHLFRVELLLRVLFFAEMPIIMLGVATGLVRNPSLPLGTALAPLLFLLFNIALGAGVRDLAARLLARPGAREAAALVVILLAASPPLLTSASILGPVREALKPIPLDWLPWTAAAAAALGENGPRPWLWLVAWTGGAWWFSWTQFGRALRFDSGAARSEGRLACRRWDWSAWIDGLFQWPSRLFPDPLGVLVEKEIRFLSRVSRFRIVFIMGFSFGLLIWLPLATRAAPSGGSWMANNFLSMVAANALLLLSEVCFYNTFGFDRSAAQMYFLVPVRPATVMAAKNIAAVFFVTVEVTLVAIGCAIFRMPVTPARIAEAGAVTAVLTLFLLGIGNLGSTRSPRSQDPNEGWRRSAGSKVALWSLLFYPLMSVPISLAYLARWAFAREAAFYAVIAVGLLIAGCFYWVSLDSAVETMRRDREKFLMLLTQGDSPAV